MTDLFPLLGNLEPKTMVEPVMEFEDLFSELLMETKEKLIEFTPLEETTEELKFEQEEIINPSLVDVFTEKENLFPEENKTDAQKCIYEKFNDVSRTRVYKFICKFPKLSFINNNSKCNSRSKQH